MADTFDRDNDLSFQFRAAGDNLYIVNPNADRMDVESVVITGLEWLEAQCVEGIQQCEGESGGLDCNSLWVMATQIRAMRAVLSAGISNWATLQAAALRAGVTQ